MLHDYSMTQQQSSSGQTHGQLLSPTESPWGGVVPPPPPMPTHLNPEVSWLLAKGSQRVAIAEGNYKGLMFSYFSHFLLYFLVF